MPDDHQHHHGTSCAHDHDHSGDLPSHSTLTGDKQSLFHAIDVDHVVALNAQGGADQGKKVLGKSWEEREDEAQWVESMDEDGLIVDVPFNSSIKLRAIIIKSDPSSDLRVESVKLFANRPGLDFSTVEDTQPEQELMIVHGKRECVEYGVRPAKFTSLSSLQMHFLPSPANDTLRIYYIGLLGTSSAITADRGAPKNIVYESSSRPVDHRSKTGGEEVKGSGVGF